MTINMLKKNPQYELRVLFYSILNGAISYGGTTVPVFESVPKGLAFPYIVISDCTWTNEQTKDKYEEDYRLTIDIYTDYGGTLDNCAILAALYEVVSEAWITNTLQFSQGPPASDYCLSMFWFGDGETRMLSAQEAPTAAHEELERSRVDMMCRVKQLR